MGCLVDSSKPRAQVWKYKMTLTVGCNLATSTQDPVGHTQPALSHQLLLHLQSAEWKVPHGPKDPDI